MRNYKKALSLVIGMIAAAFVAAPLTAATIDYTFTYDVSQWGTNVGFATGDNLVIAFEDTTDFYNITSADIFSFKYNLAAGATSTFARGGAWISDVGNIGSHFSFNGTNLTLLYDNTGGDYIQQHASGQFAQIVAGQQWHAYTTLEAGGYAYLALNSGSVSVTGTTSSVPDGGNAVLLVGLAFAGLAAMRRKIAVA